MKEQIVKILEDNFNDPIEDPCPYCTVADQILALTDGKVKAERDKWVKAIDEMANNCYDDWGGDSAKAALYDLKRQVLND